MRTPSQERAMRKAERLLKKAIEAGDALSAYSDLETQQLTIIFPPQDDPRELFEALGVPLTVH